MWKPDLADTEQPLYLALVEAIAQAIGRGELRPGERLPPQRRLAWSLGINPSTVMQAYREAGRRHLVSGEVGRGTYVLASSGEASLFRLGQAEHTSGLIDLSTNVPVHDPDNDDLSKGLAQLAARGELDALQAYPSAALVARAQLAGVHWLRRRGVELRTEQLLLCAGAQQGVSAALLALCEAGEPVLVERLTAPGIKAAARQLRLPLHGVAMDERGMLPEDLDRQARATGARVVVLTPCLQNPTGASLDDKRRAALVAVARRHDLWLIEDDVYGVLGQRAPLSALAPERCLLISSLSKSVAPGLRMGFIGGAQGLLERIDPEAQATRWAVAPLSLALACQWIEDGTAEARLRWQCQELLQRWRLAQRILGTRMAAGREVAPHLWLDQRPPVELAEACRAEGVAVVPASAFAVDGHPGPAVRISLAAARTRLELKQALEAVVRAWPL